MAENDAKTLQVDANFLKTEKKRYTVRVDRASVRSPFSFVEGALGTRLGILTILTAYTISP